MSSVLSTSLKLDGYQVENAVLDISGRFIFGDPSDHPRDVDLDSLLPRKKLVDWGRKIEVSTWHRPIHK
jgi:hypothetical protein